jgi:uncharacterized surface protein with fasciclin (FAS1) repeats
VSVDTSGTIEIGDSQIVTQDDIIAGNGILHLIDSVLGVPSIAEFASSRGEYTTLLTLLDVADIDITGLFDVTAFLPNDSAFEVFFTVFRVYEQVLLEPKWRTHLRLILLSHVGDTAFFSSGLTETFTPLSGVEFLLDLADGVFVRPSTGPNSEAEVVEPDIVTTQGAVHLIDEVLTPNLLLSNVGQFCARNTPVFSDFLIEGDFNATVGFSFGITGKLFYTIPVHSLLCQLHSLTIRSILT